MKVNHYIAFEYWGRFSIPYIINEILEYSEKDKIFCLEIDSNYWFYYQKDFNNVRIIWNNSNNNFDCFVSPLETHLGKSLYE